jgi:hypothetical protein
VSDKLFDDIGRMLAVAVHEQHRAAPGVVQPRHQGGFLAEIARQRHYLDIEHVGGKPARDIERAVGAAVVDVHHLASQPVTLAQLAGQLAKPRVQRGKPGGLVIHRHDDRQPLRRGIGGGRGQSGNIGTEHHRSGLTISNSNSNIWQSSGLVATGKPPERSRFAPYGRRNASSLANSGFSRSST